jgi:hypothetical protein
MLFGYLGLTASIMVGLGECLVVSVQSPMGKTQLKSYLVGDD